MTLPCPICPKCGHDMHQLGEPQAVTLWYTWRCPSCGQRMASSCSEVIALPNLAGLHLRYTVTVNEAFYASMLTRWYVMGDVFNDRDNHNERTYLWDHQARAGLKTQVWA